jgi:hypothetical protein
MEEIRSVILLLFICWRHKLYARGRQIFKYGPGYTA